MKRKFHFLLKDISYLEAKLIESDFKRLEMLGKDRYGNRYYWMDSNGSPLFTGQTDHYHYNCCFLWVKGPLKTSDFLLEYRQSLFEEMEIISRNK